MLLSPEDGSLQVNAGGALDRSGARAGAWTPCGIAAAVEVLGERWTFLILRGAFDGREHFEEFQSGLGIARNILAGRLERLVEHGVLRREPHASDKRKICYRLTDKGRALLPVLDALRHWGEDWVWPHQGEVAAAAAEGSALPFPIQTAGS